jgi:hypothetical protein
MDVEIGQKATRTLAVSAEMVEAFAGITGDYNPLHFDEAFAAGTRFGRLVAQGGIATGLLHALVAMDLPGPGSVFTKQEWSFPNPVYIGRDHSDGDGDSGLPSTFDGEDGIQGREPGRGRSPSRRGDGVSEAAGGLRSRDYAKVDQCRSSGNAPETPVVIGRNPLSRSGEGAG